jgi:putative transposase
MRGFGDFSSAARFCTAFEEFRQYFRPGSTRQNPMSLSEQQMRFRQNFDSLLSVSARF